MSLLTIAIILFAIGALGGLFMATKITGGDKAPWPLSIGHALINATALVLVLVGVIRGAPALAVVALIFLVVAALGGFFLASFHARDRLAPKGLILIHALAAVTGFLLLVGAVFLPAAA